MTPHVFRSPSHARPWPARVVVLPLLAIFFALAGQPALAGSKCNDYCSGPHKSYQECMDRCIAQEQSSHPWRAERSIHELCASKGHDEEECIREHSGGGERRYDPPPPYYPTPPYVPQPTYQRPQPMQCYRDQYNRLICQPD